MHSRKMKVLLSGAMLLASSFLPAKVFAEDLNIWTLNFTSNTENEALAAIGKEFEAKHPGVHVIYTQRGTDEHKTALRVAAAADSGPDIYFMWAGLGLGGEYVNAGLSLPLDKYYEKYGWSKILVPAAEAFTTLYGGHHGVPDSFRGEALYYNKDLFAKAGITTLPKNYDDLIAVANALKAKGIPAIAFGGSVNWHVMRLMDVMLETKCGATTHDALIALKDNWSETKCAVESFSQIKKWGADYVLKPFMGLDEKQAFDLFAAGRAAMLLEGSWLTNKVYEHKLQDKVGIFPFPTGTDRLYGFGQNYYISAKSKDPDMAAEFLNYYISTDVQQRYVKAFGTNPINSEVKLDSMRPLEERWKEIFGQYKSMFVNGDQAFPATIVPEYFRVINEVISGNMEPQAAADAMQSFITKNR
jgi:raffinose/stachyose/melibiose transport system substrate-binding protein